MVNKLNLNTLTSNMRSTPQKSHQKATTWHVITSELVAGGGGCTNAITKSQLPPNPYKMARLLSIKK
jgi:hypothetical protein